MNILTAFEQRVAEHPDRIALIDSRGYRTSYTELERRSAALAQTWHRQGLRAGDRVLVAMRLDADLYATLAALWRLGAAAIFPEPALGLSGLKIAVESTAPRALVLSGIYSLLRFLPGLKLPRMRLSLSHDECTWPVADLPAETPALLSFTSGSTGKPKTILRTHGFLDAQAKAVATLIGTNGAHEVDLVAFPVFVVANLGQGITSVLPNWPLQRPTRARAKSIRAYCEQHGVTRLLLSPVIAELLARDGIPAGVHCIFTGGGPVFPDLLENLHAATPTVRVVAVYGSTEAEPIAHIDIADIEDADWVDMRSGAGLLAGAPSSATKVRIVDEEIQVAGRHVIQGYLDPLQDIASKVRSPDGTIWHRTGDGGRFDERGRLWLRGRLGGRVGASWPFEIEAPARFWPGVRRVALSSMRGRSLLAIEGDRTFLPLWEEKTRELGVDGVAHVTGVPVDRRHGSKVDYARLQQMLARNYSKIATT